MHFTYEPVQIEHLDCGPSLVFAVEFPPQLVVCPGCGAVLTLVDHDEETEDLAYRAI